MISPCHQCPAIFQNPQGRAEHMDRQHRPNRGLPIVARRYGRGKSLTEFSRNATTEQIRRLNELAGHHEPANDPTRG